MKRMMAYKQMHSFLSDVWRLYAKYVVMELNDKDLEQFQEDVKAVSEKYQECAFVISVLVELINEVERVVMQKEAKEDADRC